ncbi:MAG: B12-binding domain-containing radical SAM protein [Candidatus Omnitrophota bacterium]
MDFNTLLIYLPAADFTQPYPAIPYLAAYLRQKNENVTIKDLNIDAHAFILSDEFLNKCQQNVNRQFTLLNEKQSLNFVEQKHYLKCLEALGLNPQTLTPQHYLPGFKDKNRFFDFEEYQKNTELLTQALTLISAAYFPAQMEPAGYSTPFFLSSRADIIDQTDRNTNPFIEFYEETLIPLIEAARPNVIGMSVTYHSQILQLFAVADLIKKKFPGIHLCAGGAFLTRLVLNMPRKKMKTLFEFLDSIVLYEGESALYQLIVHLKSLDAGDKPYPHRRVPSIPNVILYDRPNYEIIFPPNDGCVENLDELPPPDFDGFPLDHYLSPEIVLPYAPTRGCYWNKCAFCHYGATKEGTARYRERSIEKITADMESLAAKYHINRFAFAIDVMSPALALKIADDMIKRKLSFQWNTELKIEKLFNPENSMKLKQGGCVSVAVGLESGSARILELIDKGCTPEIAAEVIQNLSDAGIGVQVMSFTNFPTETGDEALETIAFITGNKEYISLFTFGDFELLPGSKVFKNPQKYGIKNVRYGDGDEFRIRCLYDEKSESKSEMDADRVDSAYLDIAKAYAGLEFPFVGAVSTNHTFLYFGHLGKDIFKRLQVQERMQKAEPVEGRDGLSKPRLKPKVKIIEGHFSYREITESVNRSSASVKDAITRTGQSGRQVLYKILNKNNVFPSRSYFILWDDMKWMDLPVGVKQILDLCNGENSIQDIIESVGASDKEWVETVLNNFFSLNLLIV